MENKLFAGCQSGFISGVSCVSFIIHEIYKSFDCNFSVDIRSSLLDTSKEFDKVWHEGFIFKL